MDNNLQTNNNLQTKRELFIHLILEKICTCGDKNCLLLYDGYMSNLNSEFGRRCINNKNVQYFVEQEICIKRHDTGNRMAFKLDEIEFSDPEIDTKIINKIKEFLNA